MGLASGLTTGLPPGDAKICYNQRKYIMSWKNWAVVLLAETVQCTLSEMRRYVVGKGTPAVSSGTQFMAEV